MAKPTPKSLAKAFIEAVEAIPEAKRQALIKALVALIPQGLPIPAAAAPAKAKAAAKPGQTKPTAKSKALARPSQPQPAAA